jgi:hypothetical protein
MKKTLVVAVALALCASMSAQADFLDLETRTVRADVTYDPSFSRDGAWGGELGVGGALVPLDDAGIWGGYRDHSDGIQRALGLYVEEHYAKTSPLIPYIGVGLGWAWLSNRRDNYSADSILARFQTGVKVLLNENVAVAANVLLSWTDEELWMTKTDVKDTNVGYSLGLRFYY